MARGGDERTPRLPLDALGIDNVALRVDVGAHQGVTARVAVNDQVQGNRLVAMGGLAGSSRHNPEHGPEGMGNRAALGQVAVSQQQAESVAVGGAGIGQQLIEFRLQQCGRVMGGFEAGAGGSHAEEAQQRPVMHPIKNAGVIGLQQGSLSSGENHQVPCRPVQPLTGPLQHSASLQHIEQ